MKLFKEIGLSCPGRYSCFLGAYMIALGMVGG